MTAAASLVQALPQAHQLALAYAPRLTRGRLAGLLALDARLGGIVRNSREPMLAQLRLAWWREQFAPAATARPSGEALLAALECWAADSAVLVGLVDGWEAMIGAAPLPAGAFACLAEARGMAFAALAGSSALDDTVLRMGRNWALADVAGRLSHPQECTAARELALSQDWTQARLPRELRPLAMLHALAARNLAAGSPPNMLGAGTALAMIRIGLLGR